MWCRGSRTLLQMHTVVDQPLTGQATGRISCRPIGAEPIEFEWTGPGGAPVRLDETGAVAIAAPPGRYRVTAIDATGAQADVVLEVEPMITDAIVVEGYRVTHATTSVSRDGAVEAVGEGLAGARLLWTHGAITEGPVLRDVPCGTYAAVVVGEGPMVHLCAPARVTVADRKN